MNSKQSFLTPPHSYYTALKRLERMARAIDAQKKRAARQEDEEEPEELPLPPMPPYDASRQVRRAWERQCRKIEEKNRRRRV